MYYSGTSALTRTLSLLGCELPRTIKEPAPGNERGFWPLEVGNLCREIQESAGTAWDDMEPFNPHWFQSPTAGEFRERALTVLHKEFGDSGLFVLKHPLICRLLPFWIDALEGFGATPLIVCPIRNPLEVAASLQARNKMEPRIAQMVWLRYVLDAEAASRGRQRAFARYEDLLGAWQEATTRIGEQFNLSWPRPASAAEQEIEAFLPPDLRHDSEKDTAVLKTMRLSAWVRRSFEILSRWAQDDVRVGDEDKLDRLKSAFDGAAPAFGQPLAVAREAALRGRKSEQKCFALTANLESWDAQPDDLAERLGAEQAQTRELTAKLQARDAQVDDVVKRLEAIEGEREGSERDLDRLVQSLLRLLSKKEADLDSAERSRERVRHHLSYRLGQALIEGTRSVSGLVRLPASLIRAKRSYERDRTAQKNEDETKQTCNDVSRQPPAPYKSWYIFEGSPNSNDLSERLEFTPPPGAALAGLDLRPKEEDETARIGVEARATAVTRTKPVSRHDSTPRYLPTNQPGTRPRTNNVLILTYHELTEDVRILKQADALAGIGYKVHVVCNLRSGFPIQETRGGIHVRRFDCYASDTVCKDDLELFDFLRRVKDDAHARFLPYAEACESLRRFRADVAPAMHLLGIRRQSIHECETIYEGDVHKLWAGLHPLRSLVFGANLQHLRLSEEPDVIHAHDIYTLPAAIVLARRFGARVIYDAHEYESERVILPPDCKVLADKLERDCLEHVDALITVCASLAGLYGCKWSGGPLGVIMNSTEVNSEILEENYCPPSNVIPLRARTGLGNNVPLIVYTGGVQREYRGLDKVLEALRKLPGYHLAVLGPRHLTDDRWLLDCARALGVDSRLHLLAPVDAPSVSPTIASADVAVCPIQDASLSYRFALPNKVFEAAFADVPLCVSDLPEMRSFVEELGIGRVMDQTCPDSIAEAIHGVVKNRRDYALTRAAKDLLIKKYSWEAQRVKLGHIYEELFAD